MLYILRFFLLSTIWEIYTYALGFGVWQHRSSTENRPPAPSLWLSLNRNSIYRGYWHYRRCNGIDFHCRIQFSQTLKWLDFRAVYHSSEQAILSLFDIRFATRKLDAPAHQYVCLILFRKSCGAILQQAFWWQCHLVLHAAICWRIDRFRHSDLLETPKWCVLSGPWRLRCGFFRAVRKYPFCPNHATWAFLGYSNASHCPWSWIFTVLGLYVKKPQGQHQSRCALLWCRIWLLFYAVTKA